MLVVAYFAWPSQWGGGTTYVVVKGTSMQPNFHTGDIVIARETDDHHIGDVLVYAVPEGNNGAGKLIMHRLKSIDDQGRYVIQGDNRDEPDQFDVGPEDVVGVARIHVPKVGMATQILGQWWFIALLVALFAFLKLWPDEDEDEDEADQDRQDGQERRRGADRRAAQRAGGPAPNEPAPIEPAPHEPATDQPTVEMVPPPPVSARRTRAYVIVDGVGLAHAGWPTVDLDVTRQMAVDAADDIATRFGTVAAVVFQPAMRPVSARHSAAVEFTPTDSTVADVVRAHLADRRTGLTMLVVTDALPVAEEVWALGGSVMRCSAWLSLGQHVGAALDPTSDIPVLADETATSLVATTTDGADSLDGSTAPPQPAPVSATPTPPSV
jgi:signal peptidase